MRIRTIKPEFFDSPHTAEASAVLRLAYIGLWCWADDTGHGTCNPKELEGAIFPNDDLAILSHEEFADFRGILPQLAAVFGVVFYEVDGRVFFEIPSWNRHQRTREGASSKFPMPDEGKLLFTCENTGQSDNLPQPAATRGEMPPGTGEQGNRGTGEQGNRGIYAQPLTRIAPRIQRTPTPPHSKPSGTSTPSNAASEKHSTLGSRLAAEHPMKRSTKEPHATVTTPTATPPTRSTPKAGSTATDGTTTPSLNADGHSLPVKPPNSTTTPPPRHSTPNTRPTTCKSKEATDDHRQGSPVPRFARRPATPH